MHKKNISKDCDNRDNNNNNNNNILVSMYLAQQLAVVVLHWESPIITTSKLMGTTTFHFTYSEDRSVE